MSREHILHRIRTALGRTAGQPAPDPPPARIRIPETDREARISALLRNVESLAGKTRRVAAPADAGDYAREMLAGRSAVASNAPFLKVCGIPDLPGVRSGPEMALMRRLKAMLDPKGILNPGRVL